MTTGAPTGTVTFLFTDVVGSTRMWEADPDAMHRACTRLDELVEACVGRHDGHLHRTRGEGDSHFVVFSRPADGVAAAVALQRAIAAEPWPTPGPLSVRAAVHTGDATLRDGDYYGVDVNRCARIRTLAHGGQVLVSSVTAGEIGDAFEGVGLVDLGTHRLRDLSRPERLFGVRAAGLAQEFGSLHSLDTVRHNLPVQVTWFIGRDRELAEIGKLCASRRVVTLTGPGGGGKTRLALQAAAEAIDGFPDGVWFVDLAGVTEPNEVPHAVAAAMGVREAPGTTITDAVAGELEGARTLLVLDNCEHVLRPSATLVDGLIGRCMDLTVLVTSRTPLRMDDEAVFVVPPMDLPQPEHVLEVIASTDAVRLFVDRASKIRHGWRLDVSNADAVTSICRGLEGSPLAIELAAARVRVLSPDDIASRLDDRLDLLEGGSTGVARHETLRAAVEWSCDLLTADEQHLFAELSVFASHFSLDAASEVCGRDVVHGVIALADASLLNVEEDEEGRTRYRVFDTVRRVAAEKLDGADDVHKRFVDWSAAFAVDTRAEMDGERRPEMLRRFQTEQDNLLAGLRAALASEPERALEIAIGLGAFWNISGRWTLARDVLPDVIAATEEPSANRAQVLRFAGMAATNLGDVAAARLLLEEAVAIARDVGTDSLIALCLDRLGTCLWIQGDHPGAMALLEESIELLRGTDDRRALAATLLNLGGRSMGSDLGRAKELFEQSLEIAREIGDLNVEGAAANNLGHFASTAGDHERAEELFTRAIDAGRVRGDPLQLSQRLMAYGLHLLRREEPGRARPLFEESLEMCRETSDLKGQSASLLYLAAIAKEERDPSAALVFGEQAVAISEQIGYASGAASARIILGQAYRDLGDFARAHDTLSAAAAEFRTGREVTQLAVTLVALAAVERDSGDLERAGRTIHESITKAVEAGGRYELGIGLREAAYQAAVAGSMTRAARLLGATAAADVEIDPGSPDDGGESGLRAAIYAAPGSAEAMAEGRSMSIEDAVAYAFGTGLTTERRSPPLGRMAGERASGSSPEA